jgi:hypothetical protein
MGGKIQSLLMMSLNVIAAALLLIASIHEFSRGHTAMAVYAFLAMICAIAISWNTRKPYHPRIRYKSKPRRGRRIA